MMILVTGLALFLGIHSVSIVKPGLRATVIARIGPLAWQGLYAAIALLGLLLIAWGYDLARQAPLVVYTPPVWTRHLALLLMLPVFTLLLATYLRGRIQTLTRHPMLLAVKIWAFAHLLANGTLADLLLFGALLAWAVADRISLKRREGPPVPGAPPSPINDAIAIVGGIGLYLLFMFWLHKALFGVPPLGW